MPYTGRCPVLNPLVTGLAAAAFLLWDDSQILTVSTLRPHIATTLWLQRLQVLLALGFLLRINRFLNRQALNNGVKASFDWDREVIVLTGGSRGIGAATPRKLAGRVSKVVVLDVLPHTFELHKYYSKNISYYKVDLTNFSALQRTAEQKVGEPTCIVANAGNCQGKPILEATQRDIEITFGVNNVSLLCTAKIFLPSLITANHGHFLIIASHTGHLATAGVVDYAATKAAAIAIHEGLQTKLKHIYKAPAVRMSCLAPDAVAMAMFAGIQAPSNFIIHGLRRTGSLRRSLI